MAVKKAVSFEESMESLEKIVSVLEKGELSLKESLRLFEEGIKHIRYCTKELSQAQKKLEILMQADENGVHIENFTDDSEVTADGVDGIMAKKSAGY